jgi:hypothetical protein
VRRHRLIALIGLLVLLPAQRGAADDSVFDFVGTRGDQSGSYVPSSGALVSGGFGTLAPIDGWYDEAWGYRLPVTVTSNAALTDWPFELQVDSTTTGGFDLFELARASAADLRLIGSGALIDRMSLGYWDLANNRGRLWFRLQTVMSGTTPLALYFGNRSVAPLDDPARVFVYPTPYASRYALDPAGSTMQLASSVAGNDYDVGAASGTFVNAGDLIDVAAANWTTGDALASHGPVELSFDGGAATEGVPIAFARTRHALAIPRGATNELRMIAPFADTTVTVNQNGTMVGSVSLTAGVAGSYIADTPDDAVMELVAGSPILVTHRSDDPNDGVVFPPPATEVWGIRSGTPRILAVGAAANVTIYDSTGASSTQTIAAGSYADLASATEAVGEALRIVSDNPITVISYADGDGGDAIVFHPTSELGRRWVIPQGAQFVSVALTRPGAHCSLQPAGGGSPVEVTATTNVPAKAQFGTATDGEQFAAGAVVTCDAHGMAIFEYAAADDERNLYPMEAHRKVSAAQPTATLGDTLETRYPAGVAETIETPDAIVPTAALAWTDFRVATDEPVGSEITYQVSVDGGQSWLIPDGAGGWEDPVIATLGATDGEIRDALDSLDISTGRIRLRAILLSEDGVTRPAIDAARIFYDAAGTANRLRWDPLPTTILAGESVDATITAVDGDGTIITGLSGPVALTSSAAGMVLPDSVALQNGVANFSLKLTGTADDVTVRAEGPGGIVGFSSAFDLVAPDGARIELVSGDNQFGPAGTVLGEPLTVRVLDASDQPIGGVQVTFAMVEGGGDFAGDAQLAAITDGSGLATAIYRLGPTAGPQRIRAEAAGGMVEFTARADEPGAGDGDGGCCGAAPRELPLGSGLIALAVLAVLGGGTGRSRRRRRRGGSGSCG